MTAHQQRYDEIWLRTVEDADLDAFYEYQRDPLAVRMAAVTAETREPFLDYWAEIRTDRAVLAQTVVVNGDVAGYVMCWQKWGERQVGYWIDRRYWGRGVATTALALFLAQMPVRPVHAYVAVHNGGSMRVLEKCGFRRVAEGPPLEYVMER